MAAAKREKRYVPVVVRFDEVDGKSEDRESTAIAQMARKLLVDRWERITRK